MENWYFIEYHCKEKIRNILKEIESDRISSAIKKRDSRKFQNLFIKLFLFLYKAIFYFYTKNVKDDG